MNPQRAGCPYPFKALAGVGVAFKLAEALLRGRGGLERARELPRRGGARHHRRRGAAGGREPRARAARARAAEPARARIGLQALHGGGGPRRARGHERAGGLRAGAAHQRRRAAWATPSRACGCCWPATRGEARDLAQSLEEDNQRRRRYDEEALAEAAQRVESELGWPDCASILLWSERWHAGVIGIVASRLVERFQRPAVLVALDGERGRGSGRSLPGLDLNARAGGVRRPARGATAGTPSRPGSPCGATRLPELRERLERLVGERLSRRGLRAAARRSTPRSACASATSALVEWLDRMSPHGLDNPEPLFQAADLAVRAVDARSAQGRHLRLQVRDGSGHRRGDRLRPGRAGGGGAAGAALRRSRSCPRATSGWARPGCSSS